VQVQTKNLKPASEKIHRPEETEVESIGARKVLRTKGKRRCNARQKSTTIRHSDLHYAMNEPSKIDLIWTCKQHITTQIAHRKRATDHVIVANRIPRNTKSKSTAPRTTLANVQGFVT